MEGLSNAGTLSFPEVEWREVPGKGRIAIVDLRVGNVNPPDLVNRIVEIQGERWVVTGVEYTRSSLDKTGLVVKAPPTSALTDEDFPLQSQANGIYTARDRHIATAAAGDIAADMVRRLNRDAEMVDIPRLDLNHATKLRGSESSET